MYMSARSRFDLFSRHDLLDDLRIEPDEDDDNNDHQAESTRDEREVPLLADTDAEVEAPSPPPMVQTVMVVDPKEVPADIPEASEVV